MRLTWILRKYLGGGGGGRNAAVLMDNNILACGDYGISQLEKIAGMGCRIDFNQGLDIRLVTEEIAMLLGKIRWMRHIRFSCDSRKECFHFEEKIRLLAGTGIRPHRIFCYILLNGDIEDSLYRIEMCKRLGIDAYAQPYRDFSAKYKIPQWQADMAGWCNKKSVLKSCDFRDFMPRRGFRCGEYFNIKQT